MVIVHIFWVILLNDERGAFEVCRLGYIQNALKRFLIDCFVKNNDFNLKVQFLEIPIFKYVNAKIQYNYADKTVTAICIIQLDKVTHKIWKGSVSSEFYRLLPNFRINQQRPSSLNYAGSSNLIQLTYFVVHCLSLPPCQDPAWYLQIYLLTPFSRLIFPSLLCFYCSFFGYSFFCVTELLSPSRLYSIISYIHEDIGQL